MLNPNLFNEILVWPILNILIVFYKALLFLHIPSPLGFSLILLTVVLRLIIWPLTVSQLRTSQKMQKINPHLSRLKEKHKNDSKALQAETMKLYKEHGVNPAAGCVLVLVQLPLLWGLYGVLQHVVTTKSQLLMMEINKIVYFPFLHLKTGLDQYLFGLPLGTSPLKLLPHTPGVGYLILLFPLVTGALQYVQSRMMANAAKVYQEDPSLQAKDQPEKKAEDFASAMQTQSLYIFPVMIAYFSFSLPVGLSLYWNTFTIFGIIQQYLVYRDL